jgi:hypothetical protein
MWCASLNYGHHCHYSSTEKLADRTEPISTSLQRTLEKFVLPGMFNLCPPNRLDRVICRFTNWAFTAFVGSITRVYTVQASLMEGVLAHEMHCR